MSFLKDIFTNDRGFFQGGKSFGGKGFLGEGGVLSQMKNKFKDKPYAGIPGVCPYTGKPLQTPEEQSTGVSNEARAQGAVPQFQGLNPQTGRQMYNAPTSGKFGAINQQLFNQGGV